MALRRQLFLGRAIQQGQTSSQQNNVDRPMTHDVQTDFIAVHAQPKGADTALSLHLRVGAEVVDKDDIGTGGFQPLETVFQRLFDPVAGIVIAQPRWGNGLMNPSASGNGWPPMVKVGSCPLCD